jgi:hypothetical protein
MSELQDQLLQRMLNGRQPGAGELSNMFAEHEDPRVRLIAQIMSQATVAPTPDANLDDGPATEVIEVEPPRSTLASPRVRRKLRRLVEDLREAQTIGDTLAAALGACYLCWGEDPHCEQCGGDGRPGWSEPDAELFAEYVQPAVERFREVSEHTDPSGPAGRSHFTEPRPGDGKSNRS